MHGGDGGGGGGRGDGGPGRFICGLWRNSLGLCLNALLFFPFCWFS